MADELAAVGGTTSGVFISWSGDRSKQLAQLLFDWLPDVLQSVRPFMSAASIEAGETWEAKLLTELSRHPCAVLCLTTENVTAPWLLFEAGALTIKLQNTRVIPVLLDGTPENLEKPLGMLSAVTVSEEGMLKMVVSLNSHTQNLGPERVTRSFKKHWPDLQAKIQSIAPPTGPLLQRDTREMIGELLETVRGIERMLSTAAIPTPDDAYREFVRQLPTTPTSIAALLGRPSKLQEAMLATLSRRDEETAIDAAGAPAPPTGLLARLLEP